MREAVGSAVAVVSMAVAFALATEVREASAQIPSNNVFYACIQLDRDHDEGRIVRLVSADEPCRRREQRVHWNVTGPKGPEGPRGPQGLIGPPGPVGQHGDVGAQGRAGFSVATSNDAADFCGVVGGVKLTLIDALGVPVPGTDPHFVCNGAPGAPGEKGADGPPGPPGPPGSSSAFKQVAVAQFPVTAAAASVGAIPFTTPGAGSVLVTATGLCTLSAPAALALELGPQITAANPSFTSPLQTQSWVSSATGEVPAYRSVALSRLFTVPSEGTFQIFLNEQRASTAGAATCYVTLTAFFTATLLP